MPNMLSPSAAPSFQPDSSDNSSHPSLLISFPLPTQPLSGPHTSLPLAKLSETHCLQNLCKYSLSKMIIYFLLFKKSHLWRWGLFLNHDYYLLAHVLWQSEVLHYGIFFHTMDFISCSLAVPKLPSCYTKHRSSFLWKTWDHDKVWHHLKMWLNAVYCLHTAGFVLYTLATQDHIFTFKGQKSTRIKHFPILFF